MTNQIRAALDRTFAEATRMNSTEEYTLNMVTADEIARMTDRESFVIQGCGGSLVEWIYGINKLLTESGILLDGEQFRNISAFERDGLTNLLFDTADVKFDAEKFAEWQVANRSRLGCVWLSEYQKNQLGAVIAQELENNFRMGGLQ
jgi:hypothetical protein